MNVLTKLSELKDLSNNEKILVDFILAEPENVIKARPNEIAADLFVSVSTVYRLINKLGLSGIGELKIELVAALRMKNDTVEIDYDYPISGTDSPFQMMQSLSDIYMNTIQETMSYFDPNELLQIAKRMLRAKVIDIYASSANLFFAENFKFQMQEIGVLINVPAEGFIQGLSASNSDDSHLAIVVSYGGRSKTTADIVRVLDEHNIDILLITSMQDNPLVNFAKYKIFFASTENHYNKISSFSTRFSLLYIFDLLYSIYFQMNYEDNLNFKLTNYQKMNKKLK